jgi:methionyl-tRNA formyltransferase
MSRGDIEFVCTDSRSEDIIGFSQSNRLDLFLGNPRGGRISRFIREREIDVLISVNYLFIIESDLIRLPKLLAFNVHGSLLPKYRGRTPHVWAIINNEVETGITAHIIDDGCDTGGIIEQVIIPISSDDTGATLLCKYEKAYIPLIELVLNKIRTKKIRIRKQDEEKATYFGKRNHDDGLINWNWQRERIRNWVRAQAFPYPGAFAYIDNKKVVIDKVVLTDFGFSYDEPNGLIKSIDPVLIKTPNGVIEIVDIREGEEFLIKGKIALS